MAKAVCDVCGFWYDHTELILRWDNLMVCERDYETRHPQEFVRAIPDQKPLPWTRPEPADVFVTVTYSGTTENCTPITRFGGADYATADCAQAG